MRHLDREDFQHVKPSLTTYVPWGASARGGTRPEAQSLRNAAEEVNALGVGQAPGLPPAYHWRISVLPRD